MSDEYSIHFNFQRGAIDDATYRAKLARLRAPDGSGWSADGSTYTDDKGNVWSAEAALLSGVVE